MWYETSVRRHLCDMHIDDWDERFLSKFSPEDYLSNLKKAKIQNAMLYFQSHVGLCYYPTKSGKMHNAFIGREDMMRRLADMCRAAGIAVTGYYSLIYNNWAHDQHPDWRLVNENGKSLREENKPVAAAFATNDVYRYGHCCPNNPDYRVFVETQIREIVDYFTFDAMFFDMPFWPQLCCCDHCKTRWEKEVGGTLPVHEDWNDPRWRLHIQKRREWMGEFAQFATDTVKSLLPHVTVEHNFANAISANGKVAIAEAVNDACDYVGGDLYGGIYRQSFTCKFFRGISKHQPFEYMLSRCRPTLSKHTVNKSKDELLSSVFLTTAHHGATLVIDAIDPVGTMDGRVYETLGEVFSAMQPYEAYFYGNMIEDVGVYYSIRSKFNQHNEPYTNHTCAVNTVDSLIFDHICCGVTGGWRNLDTHKIIIASCLTVEDAYDNDRLIAYVQNGGCLYFSGGDNPALIKAFFDAECTGRTKERIVYIAPSDKAGDAFDYFTPKYPMHFDGSAPLVSGVDEADVMATVTLPYTDQDAPHFASIHSNPPGVPTSHPAIACKTFGKGKVLWSALPIEGIAQYDYRRIFLRLLRFAFPVQMTIFSDAPQDVEWVCFDAGDSMLLSAVLLHEEYRAPKRVGFSISVHCGKQPRAVYLLPQETPVPFDWHNGTATFAVKDLHICNMYRLVF